MHNKGFPNEGSDPAQIFVHVENYVLAHLPGQLLISFTENSLHIFGALGPNLRSDITKDSTITGRRSKDKRNTSAHISCLM